MATRKKAKTRKAAPARTRASGRAGQQTVRAQQLRKKVDARAGEVAKLAREMDEQGVAPDEIAARVRSELAGLGAHVTEDVLKLAGSGIWIRCSGENA